MSDAYTPPLASLQAAAPALYAALSMVSRLSTDEGEPLTIDLTEEQEKQIAHALSLAEGLI